MIKKDKLKKTQIFLTKLLILSIPLYLIIWFGVDFSLLQEFTTNSAVWILNSIGIASTRDGFNILSENFAFFISKDCTGWKGMLFLFSLIVATDSKLKKKFLGIFITLPIFFSLNLIRIILMVWVGISNPGIFEILHDFLWQISMIFLVLFLWLGWEKLEINKSKNK